MSFLIICITTIFLLITLLTYWYFAPKSTVNIFFYGAITVIFLEVAVYSFALHYLQDPIRLFFDIRYGEFNLSASFSSFLLFVASMSAFKITLTKKNLHERIFYFVLSLYFAFLAADEYFMIHETLLNWEIIYAMVTASIAIWCLIVFIRHKPDHAILLYLGIFGGIGLSAVGGIGTELFFEKACFGILSRLDCSEVPLTEEILETTGFLIAAIALLHLVTEKAIHKTNFVKWTSVAWLTFIVYSAWVHPTVEQQFLVNQLEIQFDDSTMVLKGYRLNQVVFQEDDTFSIDLYWQSNHILNDNFGYTINWLDPVTGESIWQETPIIAYPSTRAWFPFITYRSHHEFPMPDEIQAPINPILTIALWAKWGDEYRIYPVESSSVPIFAEQFPILDRLSFINTNSTITPAYRFDNGILLAQPELEIVDSQAYRLTLDWSTEEDISADYSYFIHLLGEDGQDNIIFDRQPFANRFPTSGWVTSMAVQDEILLELPEDASGNYRLVMGLLSRNMDRLGISDIEGNPVANASVILAELDIELE